MMSCRAPIHQLIIRDADGSINMHCGAGGQQFFKKTGGKLYKASLTNRLQTASWS